MPGIVGIVSSEKPPAECQRLVAAMVATMMHEPFYESGRNSLPEMGLYAGWTAHPMSFSRRESAGDGREDVVVLMAGECFAGTGWPCVAQLYRQFGDRFVSQLNGLFSGFLIDRRRSRALLFNDRFGIERLYAHHTADALYFASEAKALLRVLPETRAFDWEGVSDFLTFGCTLEDRTLFRGVSALPSGSLWTFEGGDCKEARYFVPSEWEANDSLTSEGFDLALQETFTSVLPRYFQSESKLGVALTGGLDTRVIMSCRPESAQEAVCYTYAGTSGETLDVRLAAEVARECAMKHHIVRLGPDFLTEFATHANRTVHITDGGLGILGSHELYLSARARELADVRVTGVFGGEILRGVSTFKSLDLAPDLVDRSYSVTTRRPPLDPVHPVRAAAFRETPWQLSGSLTACRSQLTFRTPFLDNEIVSLAFCAPDSVRTSPRAAARLVRESNPPLGRIPTDRGDLTPSATLHSVVRRIIGNVGFKLDYLSSEGLPPWLSRIDPILDRLYPLGMLGHHKYLRYRRWLRLELAEYMREGLIQARQNPLWDRRRLDRIADEHVLGSRNYVHEINSILTLEAVDRLLIRGARFDESGTAAQGEQLS